MIQLTRKPPKCKNCRQSCQFPCARCGACTMFMVFFDGENKCMDCSREVTR